MNNSEITTAINYYEYGIKCDIFQEPVLSYAKLALEGLKLLKKNYANGVIVPPCKVGDTVYVIWFSDDTQSYKMAEHTVTDISTKTLWLEEDELFYPLTAIGEEVFLTKEEAEAALRLRKEDEGK